MGRFAESPGQRFDGAMPELTEPTRQQKITLGEIRSSGVSRPLGLLRGLQVQDAGRILRKADC